MGYVDHGRRHSPFGSDPIRFAEYEFKLFSDAEYVASGDGALFWRVPRSVDGLKLIAISIYVSTVSSSGAPTLQIHNLTAAADMLSTAATIDASEYLSDTAAAPAVIDATEALVAAGDRIRFDVDAAGTGAKGLGGTLTFG